MSFNDIVTRVYRETVASYHGAAVPRAELIASAEATLMIELNAGRLELDVGAAIRAALTQADERDGRAADRVLARAARGDVMLTDDDLDLVVTLGSGMRKAWRDVRREDLEAMNSERYQNYKKVRESYQVFNADVLAVLPVLAKYGTFGAAHAAGGFPPPPAREAAA